VTAVTVSEETLKRILAEFKVDLVKDLANYATITALEKVEREVELLKLWQAAQLGGAQEHKAISDRAIAVCALCITLLAAITTLVWLHHG
jgi:hypothetical protein